MVSVVSGSGLGLVNTSRGVVGASGELGQGSLGRAGERVTVKNLKVVRVDEENNLIYVRGAVPGGSRAYVAIRRAKRG